VYCLAFYRALIENFSDWQRDELAVSDVVERDRFRMLVEKEARLLDQLRFDEWLALYTPECLYWVPTSPQAGDPRIDLVDLRASIPATTHVPVKLGRQKKQRSGTATT